MDYAPIARIILRYLSGLSFGGAPLIAPYLATDPDVVMLCAAIVAAVVEIVYAWVKRNGGAT